MRTMPENSVSSIVTDPPYHLKSIVKRFGKESSAPAQFGSDGAYSRHSTGFMGKKWDGGDISHDPATWAECLRVAKPGAYLLAFGGTRTWHRLAVAIEDAGWELRDTIMWVYGSGFPKSHDVSKAIDKMAGAKREKIVDEKWASIYPNGPKGKNTQLSDGGRSNRVGLPMTSIPATDAAKQWEGWGTALKPAWEPIILARKPVESSVASNVLKYGTGAMNIDASRVELDGESVPINKLEEWSGFGQKVKPEYEQEINTKGRWPANLIHDGSDEVIELFPDSDGQQAPINGDEPSHTGTNGIYGTYGRVPQPLRIDSGSASRFFYCAKATKQERDAGLENLPEKDVSYMNTHGGDAEKGEAWNPVDPRTGQVRDRFSAKVRNFHPTVKPIALMRYLCKLVTPPDGLVFDPFMGSGSTGVAALLEGYNFIGCELEEDYFKIAKQRISTTLIQEEFFKGE